MPWPGWPNPTNHPPYPPENTPLWFAMRRKILQDCHNAKIAGIRYSYEKLRGQARQTAAGELLEHILAAHAENEAEELRVVQREFYAEWTNLNASEWVCSASAPCSSLIYRGCNVWLLSLPIGAEPRQPSQLSQRRIGPCSSTYCFG